MIPPADIQPTVDFFLLLTAASIGVSVDSLTTDDLWSIAFAIRSDPRADAQAVAAANAIDGLSSLENDDLDYLEELAGTPTG